MPKLPSGRFSSVRDHRPSAPPACPPRRAARQSRARREGSRPPSIAVGSLVPPGSAAPPLRDDDAARHPPYSGGKGRVPRCRRFPRPSDGAPRHECGTPL